MNLAGYRRWNNFPIYGSPEYIFLGGGRRQQYYGGDTEEKELEAKYWIWMPYLWNITNSDPHKSAFISFSPKKTKKEITYYHFLLKLSFSKCLHYVVSDLWACVL